MHEKERRLRNALKGAHQTYVRHFAQFVGVQNTSRYKLTELKDLIVEIVVYGMSPPVTTARGRGRRPNIPENVQAEILLLLDTLNTSFYEDTPLPNKQPERNLASLQVDPHTVRLVRGKMQTLMQQVGKDNFLAFLPVLFLCMDESQQLEKEMQYSRPPTHRTRRFPAGRLR